MNVQPIGALVETVRQVMVDSNEIEQLYMNLAAMVREDGQYWHDNGVSHRTARTATELVDRCERALADAASQRVSPPSGFLVQDTRNKVSAARTAISAAVVR